MAKQNTRKSLPRNSDVTVTSKRTPREKGSSCLKKKAATGNPSRLVSNLSSFNMEEFLRELDSYFEEKLGSGAGKSTKKRMELGSGAGKSTKKRMDSISEPKKDGAAEQGKGSKRVRFSNVLDYSEQDYLLKTCSPMPENGSCTSITLSSEGDCGPSYSNTKYKCDLTKTKSSITPVLYKTNVSTPCLATPQSPFLPEIPHVQNKPIEPSIHSPSLPAILQVQNQPVEPSHNLSMPSSQQTGVVATPLVKVSRAKAPVQCASSSKHNSSQTDHTKTIVQPTEDRQPVEKTLRCSPTQVESLQRSFPSGINAPENTSAIYTSTNSNFENYLNAGASIGNDTKLDQVNTLRDDPPLAEHFFSNKDGDGTDHNNTASGTVQKHCHLAGPSVYAIFRGGGTASLTSKSTTGTRKLSSVKHWQHFSEDKVLANGSSKNNKQVVSIANFDEELLHSNFRQFGSKDSSLDYAVTNCSTVNIPVVFPSPLNICTTNCATDVVSQTTSSRVLSLRAADGMTEDPAPFDYAVTNCSTVNIPVVFPSPLNICTTNCATDVVSQTTSSRVLSLRAADGMTEDPAPFETLNMESSSQSIPKTVVISTFNNEPKTLSSSSSACSITRLAPSSPDSGTSITSSTKAAQAACASATRASSNSSNCSSDSVLVSSCVFSDFGSLSDSSSRTSFCNTTPICSITTMTSSTISASNSSDSKVSSVSSTDLTMLGADRDFELRVPHAFNKYCLCSLPLMCQGHETGPFCSMNLARAVPASRADLRTATDVVLLPRHCGERLKLVTETEKCGCRHENRVYTDLSSCPTVCKTSSVDRPEKSSQQHSIPDQKETQFLFRMTSISLSGYKTSKSASLDEESQYTQPILELKKRERAKQKISGSAMTNCMDESQNDDSPQDKMETDACQHNKFTISPLLRNNDSTPTCNYVPHKVYLTSVPESSCCEDDDSCSSFAPSQLEKTLNTNVRKSPNLVVPYGGNKRTFIRTASIEGPHQTTRELMDTVSINCVVDSPDKCSLSASANDGRIDKKRTTFPSAVNPQDSDSMGPTTREIFQYHMTSRCVPGGTCADPRGELSLSPWSPARLSFGLDKCDEVVGDTSVGIEGVRPQLAKRGEIKPVRKLQTLGEKETCSASHFIVDEDAKQCRRNASSPGNDPFKKPFPVTTSSRPNLKRVSSSTNGETGANGYTKDKTDGMKIHDTREVTGRQSYIPTEEKVTDSLPSAAVYAVQSSRETGIDTQELFRTQLTPCPSVDRESRQHIPGNLSPLLCEASTYQMLRKECHDTTVNNSSAKSTCNKESSRTEQVKGFAELPAPEKFLASRKVDKTNVINKNTLFDQQLTCSYKEHNVDVPMVSGCSSSANRKAIPFNKEDVIEIIKCCGEIDRNELLDNFTHDPTLVTPKSTHCNVRSPPSNSTTNAHTESTITSFASSSANSHESIKENKSVVTAVPSFSATRRCLAVTATRTTSTTRGRRALPETPSSNNARGLYAAPDCECQSCRGYTHLATSFMVKLFHEARTSCTSTNSGAGHQASGLLPSCIQSISEEEQLTQRTRNAKRPRMRCRRRLAFVDSDSSSIRGYNPYRKKTTARDSSNGGDTSEAEVLSPQRKMRKTCQDQACENRQNSAVDNIEVNILSPQPKIQISGHGELNKNNTAWPSKLKEVSFNEDSPQERAVVKSSMSKPLITTLLYNTIGQDTVRVNPYKMVAEKKSKSRKKVQQLDACYV